MKYWEAALVVLFDAGPNATLRYIEDIHERIKERGLCRFAGKTPWKTVRTAMQQEQAGLPFIRGVGGRSGRYMLRDYEKARSAVRRIKARYPSRFPSPSHNDAAIETAPISAARKVPEVAAKKPWAGLVHGRTEVSAPDQDRRALEKAVSKLQSVPPQLIAEEVNESEQYVEGATLRISINSFECNPEARAACIRKWKDACSVCRFRFGIHFGKIGEGFIHVHHLRPLAEIRSESEIDPVNDLRPVCPNCHAMLHKSKPPFSIEELKRIRRKARRISSRGKTRQSPTRKSN